MSLKEKLLNSTADEYGDRYQDHMVEIYKVYVQSAENISNRRQLANSFFLTLNTALIGVSGYLREAGDSIVWTASVVGILLCFAWYRLIRSYKDLNSAKFKVVHAIEANLPISVFDAEWEAVGRGKNTSLYLPFTKVELWIPRIFLAFYVTILPFILPWATLTKALCQSG